MDAADVVECSIAERRFEVQSIDAAADGAAVTPRPRVFMDQRNGSGFSQKPATLVITDLFILSN